MNTVMWSEWFYLYKVGQIIIGKTYVEWERGGFRTGKPTPAGDLRSPCPASSAGDAMLHQPILVKSDSNTVSAICFKTKLFSPLQQAVIFQHATPYPYTTCQVYLCVYIKCVFMPWRRDSACFSHE